MSWEYFTIDSLLFLAINLLKLFIFLILILIGHMIDPIHSEELEFGGQGLGFVRVWVLPFESRKRLLLPPHGWVVYFTVALAFLGW